MKQLFLDIETTGFSRDWNEIIELAAILYDTEKQEIIDSFHQYARPVNGKIPAAIEELTGITAEKVSGCRPEWEVLMHFCDWCDLYDIDAIVGHNCKSFDLNFINAKNTKFGIKWEPKAEIIDTLVLARQLKKKGLLNTPNMKQPTLAEHFGIQYEAHSAIEDVKALIKVYQALEKCAHPSRDSLGF